MAQKKMIMIDSGLSSEPDFYVLSPEDDSKTLSELILEIAERKEAESEDGAMEATQMRGLIQSHRMYSKGREIPASTRIQNLNFDMQLINEENVQIAEINLQRQHTGGL